MAVPLWSPMHIVSKLYLSITAEAICCAKCQAVWYAICLLESLIPECVSLISHAFYFM